VVDIIFGIVEFLNQDRFVYELKYYLSVLFNFN